MSQKAALALVLLLVALPAQAASSAWFETEGGRIRLVTTGVPAADGTLRAALQIDVSPGWKTYWRDPGDAGVPPQITFPAASGVTTAEIGFPVPQRFDDGASHWAGYEWPIALALTLHATPGRTTGTLEADVFMGLCQSICVPVQAQLTLDPHHNADDMFDRATVNAAFDSLPAKASPSFGVTAARIEGDMLIVETAAPTPEGLTLFLASNGGFEFGVPKHEKGGARFAVPLLARPTDAATSASIAYTLSNGDAAVDGAFTLP
ncbi:protein-disulfide reductase DsbD domain-containing protein [Tianweitania sp.]|uniref:protein-disulfide reductase DsbD domain-containing protein n=1 Tax=Tianweitania sp. TaxID=2021634 RepID=UPI002897ABA6|nr:protein-disulfide reductase DsbD domain-containing protein [Tianweitania sp.]